MTRPSIVVVQKARIAVQQSVEQLKAETQRWEKQFSDDRQVVDLAQYVRTYTKQVHQKLADALDKAFTEKDDKKAAYLYGQASKVAEGINKQIADNPKIASLKRNPKLSIHGVDVLRARISDLDKLIR